MTELETRLREAMHNLVAEEMAPADVLFVVRRRHRRRSAKLAATATAAAAAVAAITVGAVQLATGHSHRPISVTSFPGGGRLLFAKDGELIWLYADGRHQLVAEGFTAGAVQGRSLVAGRLVGHSSAYYVMRFDGTDRRVLVPAERDRQRQDFGPVISPDGSLVAYIQQVTGLPHRQVQQRLEVRDLNSGRVTDLGQINGSFWWRDSAGILVGAANTRSLLVIDVASGARSTYLSVSDPSIVAAYEAARPSAGPPSFISPDGWRDGPGQGPLAISVASSTSSTRFSQPAEMLYDGRTVTRTYAPQTTQQLGASWAPHGLLLLTTGAGDVPGWDTQVATAASDEVSKPISFGMTGARTNPEGTVIAMQDDNLVTFAPVPGPACGAVGRCLRFSMKFLSDRGQLLAWEP